MKTTKNTTTAAAFDEDAIRELTLFSENCRAVYCGSTIGENIPGPAIFGPGLEAMQNCIINHIIKGDATEERAEKGLFSVFTFASKVYERLFGSEDGARIFTPFTRHECARRYVRDHWNDWSRVAMYEMRDRVLARALKDLYISNDNWTIQPEDASINTFRRVANWCGKLAQGLQKQANESEQPRRVFFLSVRQAVLRIAEAWLCGFILHHGQPAINSEARAILKAAKSVYQF